MEGVLIHLIRLQILIYFQFILLIDGLVVQIELEMIIPLIDVGLVNIS